MSSYACALRLPGAARRKSPVVMMTARCERGREPHVIERDFGGGGRAVAVAFCSHCRRLMTFSRQILAGLALGILTGLFFGEQAAVLKWAADGFVKLLQMMVLPYITVSIIASLGSLRPPRSARWACEPRPSLAVCGWWRCRSRS